MTPDLRRGHDAYAALRTWLNAQGIRPPSFGLGRKNDRSDWTVDGVRELLRRERCGGTVHGVTTG
ncbi:MAG: hypothetical protein KGJ98_10140 [Chloroflexota bacterium]|nr:hypothetical protein [Chloroflexota bacterium]